MTWLRRAPLAAAALLAAVSTVPAQPPGGPPAPPAVPKGLEAVPRDGFLVLTVDVAKLWDDPALKGVRDWLTGQKADPIARAFGIPLADAERATLYLPAFRREADFVPVVFLTSRRPYNEARVVKNLLGRGDGGDRGDPGDPHDDNRDGPRLGNTLRLPNGNPFGVAVLTDDRNILFMPRDWEDRGGAAMAALVGQLVARKADGPLAPALAAAGTNALSLGLDPRPIGRVANLPEYAAAFKAASATLTADHGADGVKVRLAVVYPDAADARRAGPVIEEAISDLGKMLAESAGREAERGEHGALPAALMGWAAGVLKTAKVEVKDAVVVAAADGRPDALAQVVAALPKQLVASANTSRAINNFKQLGIGMHAIHDVYNTFPGDVVQLNGPPGKLAWSWRVQILPYVEEDQIYRQLDHQQAWDGPKNKAILEKAEMPKVFEIPGRPAPKGHTYIRVFTLPKKADPVMGRPLFVEGERGPRITSITDGTSNTFMLVEAGEAVPWYAPDVLAYDGKLPLPQLGAKGADGFIAALCDGSVRVVRTRTDEKTLRAAITRDGGEVLTLPDR